MSEKDIPLIGFGAMLVEGFVAVMALIAATILIPGDYFAINTKLHFDAIAALGFPVERVSEFSPAGTRQQGVQAAGKDSMAAWQYHRKPSRRQRLELSHLFRKYLDYLADVRGGKPAALSHCIRRRNDSHYQSREIKICMDDIHSDDIHVLYYPHSLMDTCRHVQRKSGNRPLTVGSPHIRDRRIPRIPDGDACGRSINRHVI